jgi:hypothetical protein
LRIPSPDDLLDVWETGERRSPLDRALLLLAAASPEATWEELAALPIGRRDAALLDLRERLFGGQLPFYAACPACGEHLEFTGSTRALAQRPPSSDTVEVALAGRSVTVRQPDSRDIAAVARLRGVDAERALIARCLVDDDLEALGDDDLERIATALADADPQAHVWFDLTCPACGARWPAAFDVASLLWTEVQAQARRILVDVDTLARAYGWSEPEVLALSARRRSTYVAMVLG